jgi:hypothetical protein
MLKKKSDFCLNRLVFCLSFGHKFILMFFYIWLPRLRKCTELGTRKWITKFTFIKLI